MDNASPVPYQPYRSKRHSRTPSAPPDDNKLDPAPSLLNGHSLTSAKQPAVFSSPGTPSNILLPLPSPSLPETPTKQFLPSITPSPERPFEQPLPPSSPTITSSLPETPSQQPQPQPTSSFRHVPVRTSFMSSPSQLRSEERLDVSLNGHSPSKQPQPTSTIRHVPLRKPSTPRTSSPLRPDVPSPSFSRHPTTHPIDSHLQQAPPDSRPSLANPRRVSSFSSVPPPAPAPPIGATPASTSSGPPSLTASPSPPSTSPSPSPVPTGLPVSRKPAAPYLPGFQPKGVYRPRTDEFTNIRSTIRERDKVEQRRLERRLEKLIALHFPATPTPSPSQTEDTKACRRSSLLFDLDFSKNPADLWRDVVESRMQTPKSDIRMEEQRITPWQDDADVSQCPLCKVSFHPLTNRKHHCRLCGRIICSLPPRPPTRSQTCSLLFVVDQGSGRIEEVGEGVDYGVKKRGSVKGKGEEDDRFLKGVRICRDCRTVLLRQQYLQEASRVPTFARLYATLVILEKDIEETLPQFQELVLSLSTNSSPQSNLSVELRKRLLDSFSEYDRLAKRIRQLPAPAGGSQDRVQNAIMTRANLFLQKNMFPLQSLPKAQKQKLGVDPPPAGGTAGADVGVDGDAQLARALQPLLEQEARLESFVEEARVQRKFEDARTLKANLAEIRVEIARIAQGGGVGGNG